MDMTCRICGSLMNTQWTKGKMIYAQTYPILIILGIVIARLVLSRTMFIVVWVNYSSQRQLNKKLTKTARISLFSFEWNASLVVFKVYMSSICQPSSLGYDLLLVV